MKNNKTRGARRNSMSPERAQNIVDDKQDAPPNKPASWDNSCGEGDLQSIRNACQKRKVGTLMLENRELARDRDTLLNQLEAKTLDLQRLRELNGVVLERLRKTETTHKAQIAEYVLKMGKNDTDHDAMLREYKTKLDLERRKSFDLKQQLDEVQESDANLMGRADEFKEKWEVEHSVVKELEEKLGVQRESGAKCQAQIEEVERKLEAERSKVELCGAELEAERQKNEELAAQMDKLRQEMEERMVKMEEEHEKEKMRMKEKLQWGFVADIQKAEGKVKESCAQKIEEIKGEHMKAICVLKAQHKEQLSVNGPIHVMLVTVSETKHQVVVVKEVEDKLGSGAVHQTAPKPALRKVEEASDSSTCIVGSSESDEDTLSSGNAPVTPPISPTYNYEVDESEDMFDRPIPHGVGWADLVEEEESRQEKEQGEKYRPPRRPAPQRHSCDFVRDKPEWVAKKEKVQERDMPRDEAPKGCDGHEGGDSVGRVWREKRRTTSRGSTGGSRDFGAVQKVSPGVLVVERKTAFGTRGGGRRTKSEIPQCRRWLEGFCPFREKCWFRHE